MAPEGTKPQRLPVAESSCLVRVGDGVRDPDPSGLVTAVKREAEVVQRQHVASYVGTWTTPRRKEADDVLRRGPEASGLRNGKAGSEERERRPDKKRGHRGDRTEIEQGWTLPGVEEECDPHERYRRTRNRDQSRRAGYENRDHPHHHK